MRLSGRAPRLAAGMVGIALSAGLLGACGNSKLSGPGAEACGHVATAQKDMRAAAATSGSAAHKDKLHAQHQLDLAEPLAAVAAGTNGGWQALQANLQELKGVPDKVLMRAVAADCTAIR